MQILVGLVIIATVALSSLVFLVICLLMAESLVFGSRNPRVSEWFVRKLHESHVHAARGRGSRFAH
jgi:hypothetical protein